MEQGPPGGPQPPEVGRSLGLVPAMHLRSQSPFSAPVGSLLVETRAVAVKVCRESRVWPFSAELIPAPGHAVASSLAALVPRASDEAERWGAFSAPHFTLALSESPPDLQIHGWVQSPTSLCARKVPALRELPFRRMETDES